MITLFGTKLGMTLFFTSTGKTFASTILKLEFCFVIKHKFKEIEGYNALQVGYGFCFAKNLKKSIFQTLDKKNLIPLQYIKEILITNPRDFKIGQSLDTSFLVQNDFISIQSQTIGKGFCGTIKRHKFVKGPVTHGSKNHRQPGAIGQGTTPGRVFKGKKLAGHVGNVTKSLKHLQILHINLRENLIILKGNINGLNKTTVKLLSTLA